SWEHHPGKFSGGFRFRMYDGHSPTALFSVLRAQWENLALFPSSRDVFEVSPKPCRCTSKPSTTIMILQGLSRCRSSWFFFHLQRLEPEYSSKAGTSGYVKQVPYPIFSISVREFNQALRRR